jgi:hypothetical protein
VNPLPHSLLNFVFDFGNLNENDEKDYITNIIKEKLEEFFVKYKKNINDNLFIKIHELAINLIVESQNFIRKENDISSVSLREIRRFNIFYEFFFNYLNHKKETDINKIENRTLKLEEDYNFYSKLTFEDIQMYSIILSTFVCYYLRIPDNKTREKLNSKLSVILQNYDIKYKNFLEVPKREEKFIAKNIELEKGIARNRALLDNLFALFVTINTKVPIFIVGKPGCSKSLSVQLINKSMKGDSSSNYIFKNLPRIIMNSYQGSMGSTSKGVKSVFKRARAKLRNIMQKEAENYKEQKVISVIYFDGMDLVEHPQIIL